MCSGWAPELGADAKYWIGVAAAEHVAIARSEQFCMFAHGKGSAAKKLSPGDGFAYYSPRQGMDSGETIRAFTAIGIVEEGPLAGRDMGGHGTGIMRPARYLDCQHCSIYPLLDELAFVKKPSHWGMYFRRSLFEIPAQDFHRIASAMGVGDSFKP